ncbi:MAG TPA: hypothetical protein VIY96_06090 [Thermoanaerobaculia bacterium]
MKTRITALAGATLLTIATVGYAQQPQTSSGRTSDSGRTPPQAQQVPDQPEIQTRTAAPSTRQGQLPQTTTYTNPPVAVQAPAPPPVAVEVPAPVEPAPAPIVAETTTTTYEELPGSASPYPSIALGGLALIAAGALIQKKSR